MKNVKESLTNNSQNSKMSNMCLTKKAVGATTYGIGFVELNFTSFRPLILDTACLGIELPLAFCL